LSPFVEEVLTHVAPLLVLQLPTSSKLSNDTKATTKPSSNDAQITTDDQLFVYEATATLIVVGNFTAQTKHDYMQRLIGALADNFVHSVNMYKSMNDMNTRQMIGQYAKQIMAFAR
jgi:hypothetical protein